MEQALQCCGHAFTRRRWMWSALTGYGDFTPVVEAMLGGGFTPAETAKIVGGNYLRIFEASTG